MVRHAVSSMQSPVSLPDESHVPRSTPGPYGVEGTNFPAIYSVRTAETEFQSIYPFPAYWYVMNCDAPHQNTPRHATSMARSMASDVSCNV